MKRFSEQFKKKSEAIHLKASERNALRERVVSYMEYHPLPKDIRAQKTVAAPSEVIISEPFKTIRFNPFYVRSFASAFAVFFIMSVPFIAERAVPGDVLYPVKVQFNEELRSSLSLSPYAKVAWETQRLERRISEARLLALEGKLTEETELKVAAAVKTHTDTAQRKIAELRKSDSDEAAIAEIALASALAVQTEMLESHIEKDIKANEGSEKGRSVLAIAQVVAQAQTTAEAAQSGTQPSYAKLLASIEQGSTHVYELFKSVKKDATGGEIADVERRLSDIERKISQAIALKEGKVTTEPSVATMALSMAKQLPNGEVSVATNTPVTDESVMETVATEATSTEDSSETLPLPAATTTRVIDSEAQAVALLRSAFVDLQKLLSYMTHIDVRLNVSINDLVPLTLTAEERGEEVVRLFNDSIAMLSIVDSKDLSSRYSQKVAKGREEAQELLDKTSAAMTKGDVDAAYEYVVEAYNYAFDLERLTANEPLKESSPSDEVNDSVEVSEEIDR